MTVKVWHILVGIVIVGWLVMVSRIPLRDVPHNQAMRSAVDDPRNVTKGDTIGIPPDSGTLSTSLGIERDYQKISNFLSAWGQFGVVVDNPEIAKLIYAQNPAFQEWAIRLDSWPRTIEFEWVKDPPTKVALCKPPEETGTAWFGCANSGYLFDVGPGTLVVIFLATGKELVVDYYKPSPIIEHKVVKEVPPPKK